MPQQDEQRDRLSIPTSSATEQEDLRNQQYSRESNAQDLSDADDRARDRGLKADDQRDGSKPGVRPRGHDEVVKRPEET